QRWRQCIHDLRRQKPLPDGWYGEIQRYHGNGSLHFRGTSRGGRRPLGLYRQPQGHLGDQITEAAADCSEPCQGAEGRISTGPPNWTSLIYNRAEQVIVDVRYWHLADIDGQEEHVRY